MGGCFRRLRLFGLEIVLVLIFLAAVNTDMHWNDKWNLNLFTRSPQTPYFVKSWDLAMLFLSWTWSNHNDRCLFLWKGRKVAGQKQSVFSWTMPIPCAAASWDLSRLLCFVTLMFLRGVRRRSHVKKGLSILLPGSPLPIIQPNTFHFPYSQLLN